MKKAPDHITQLRTYDEWRKRKRPAYSLNLLTEAIRKALKKRFQEESK